MTQQVIAVGTSANDNTGDQIRTAFIKTNANFSELYTRTYGCFHKTANVTAGAADTVYSFDWSTDTTAHVNNQGVTVSSSAPTNVVIERKDYYQAFLEMQVKSTVNATRIAYIWLSINGVDILESCLKAEIKQGGAVEAHQLISKSWVLGELQASDYLEVKFAVSDPTGISLEYLPVQTIPYARPAVPSAIFTITSLG